MARRLWCGCRIRGWGPSPAAVATALSIIVPRGTTHQLQGQHIDSGDGSSGCDADPQSKCLRKRTTGGVRPSVEPSERIGTVPKFPTWIAPVARSGVSRIKRGHRHARQTDGAPPQLTSPR
jgi:hypothetical protein